MTICQVPGCDKSVKNRSLCWAHYERQRKYGSYDLPAKKSLFQTFAESVEVDEPDKCWLWQGNFSTTGLKYGRLNVNRKSYMAHRLSYEFLVEPIKDGLLALHKCDNPKCVNPHHLYAGTHKDNAIDRATRKPNSFAVGERAARAKLTSDQVVEIRNDSRSCYKLAKEYKVSPSLISMIKNRKIWAHLGA